MTRLDQSREWYEKRIAAEGVTDVTAGSLTVELKVTVRARPSRLLRPTIYLLHYAGKVGLSLSEANTDRLVTWLVGRSYVEVSEGRQEPEEAQELTDPTG